MSAEFGYCQGAQRAVGHQRTVSGWKLLWLDFTPIDGSNPWWGFPLCKQAVWRKRVKAMEDFCTCLLWCMYKRKCWWRFGVVMRTATQKSKNTYRPMNQALLHGARGGQPGAAQSCVPPRVVLREGLELILITLIRFTYTDTHKRGSLIAKNMCGTAELHT